ncbi:MAG TPA: hypothetical protein VLH94_01760 [Spirochaetia bacterium]|nr:hypothetical protein [Spirochaetia bacterium]
MNKLNHLFITVFSLFATLFFAPQVSAQQMTMTAIPPRVELKGDPGQTLTASLKLRNDSENSEIFSISVEDFIVIDSKGTPIPVNTNISNRWSLRNWITSPKEVPVDAKDVQLIDISIKIPMTALPGGHYAMITYTPNANVKAGDLKQTGNVITQRVGTLIYVTVSGPITEKATITRFSVPKFLEKGPVEFEGSIESMSDTHVNPKGTITISDPLNNKVAEIKLDAGNIFPESTRDFNASWDQKWGWGRYKADLNLTYGTAGSLLAATIFFWFFPIRLVIYGLIALISILTIIIILNKRSQKHQQDLEKEVQLLKEELQQVENK